MLPKIIEDRKTLLQNNDVLEKLGEMDLLITEKSVNAPIRNMDKATVFRTLTEMSSNILLDIGLKNADPYEIGRFADIVMKYYKRFSLQEIKLAFELLLIGELDFYLPKDRNGQPDKNHYQSFSAEYITKVLRAYSRRRDKTWGRAYLALPPKERYVVTEKDREKSRERFVNDIKKVFSTYREEQARTVIYIPAYWVDFLNKKGFIKVEPELGENTIKAVYQRIINNDIFVSESDKTQIEKDYKSGKRNQKLIQKAQYQYYYDLIYKFFDYVIEHKQDLNKML